MSIDRPSRQRKRPWDSIYDSILVPYWRKAFLNSISKWKPGGVLPPAGQGACNATVTLTFGKTFNGSYDPEGYHAEMEALKNAGTWDPATILRIDISSKPCPRCAVVLELKKLSGKVYTDRTTSTTTSKTTSTTCPSGNWPISNEQELVDIITHPDVTPAEKEDYRKEIFSHFQSAGWVPKDRK